MFKTEIYPQGGTDPKTFVSCPGDSAWGSLKRPNVMRDQYQRLGEMMIALKAVSDTLVMPS
jgi:hypothetical protein